MATIAEFVLRVGFAVALIFASPFLLLFILSYQEHPELALMSGGIAAWLLMKIFVPRRYQ